MLVDKLKLLKRWINNIFMGFGGFLHEAG